MPTVDAINAIGAGDVCTYVQTKRAQTSASWLADAMGEHASLSGRARLGLASGCPELRPASQPTAWAAFMLAGHIGRVFHRCARAGVFAHHLALTLTRCAQGSSPTT